MKPEASFLFSLSFLILFLFCSYAVVNIPFVTSFDEMVYAWVASQASPTWLCINRGITFFGNGGFLFSLTLIVFIYLCIKGFIGGGGLVFHFSACWFFAQCRPKDLF